MRATKRSWWFLLWAALGVGSLGAGCDPDANDRGFLFGETADDPAGDPAVDTSGSGDEACPGTCVTLPPAPFNSRIHLVWIGSARTVPDCPSFAPYQGMEGHVLSMDKDGEAGADAGKWVRECLISTGAGACEQGTTCAPAPPVDYELCISREEDGPCPADHYPRHVVAQEPGEPPAEPLTFCCTSTAARAAR